MAQNSLLGVRKAATEAKGRDNAALGPGDSSDSGGDLAVVSDPTMHDDEDPDLTFMDEAPDAQGALSEATAPDPLSDELPAEKEEAVVDAAAARRSAMHDRERDARLGRLHCKRKKPRPLFDD